MRRPAFLKYAAICVGWCILYVMLPATLKAQYVFKNYSTIDGMPSTTVYGSVQDSIGFLWFATDKRLCRFDGSDFFEFDMSENQMSGMTTMALHISNEHIVAGTYSGFISIVNNKVVEKLNLSFENTDYDNQSLTYVNGLLYYRTKDNSIGVYDVKRHENYLIGEQDSKKPFCMTKTSAGKVYYSQTGLYIIQNLNSLKLNIPQLNNREISALYADRENTLWVSSGDMVYKLKNHLVVDSVKCHFYSGNPLYVNNSEVFGLVIYDHYGHGNEAYYELSDLFDKSSKSIITSMFEDRDMNLWVNTYNKGTYCILNTYVSAFFGKSELDDASIQDIYVSDEQEILMATSRGVVVKKDNEFYQFANTAKHFCYGITKTGDHLLLAMAGIDVPLKKAEDKVLRKSIYQMSARRHCVMNDTTVVLNEWDNSIYIAAIDFGNERLQIKDKIVLGNMVGRCTGIFKRDKSHVIVSTVDACYLVDIERKISERMVEIGSMVTDIVRDASGSVYMASEAGLYILKNNRTHLLREINGVKLKNLSALALDDKGRLWIGCNKGLIVWKGNFLRRISGSPFLKSYEINKLVFEKKHNCLYVATNSGLSVIDITKMDHHILKDIDIVVLKLQSGDSIYNINRPVNLRARNNDLDIYFSAINICSPQDLYFRYTLNSGRTWTIIGTKQISLRGLGYGDHKIEIQASLDGINWGKKSTVKFYVDYPFYATIKFWARLLVVIVVVIFLLVKLRIRSIREKARMELEFQQKLEDLRYEALNAAVNPHFIFNTLGAIQSFVVHKDPFQASDYIAKFARLIRITLNHAGQRFISIEEEINRLSLYLELEKLRNGHKLDYSIHLDKSVNRFGTIPNMIIQPLIENAILHGVLPLEEGTGVIELSIQQEHNFLIIQVKDNGVGLHYDVLSKHGYPSIGLSNLEERLSLIKGSSFKMKNRKEIHPSQRGTLVVISLPL